MRIFVILLIFISSIFGLSADKKLEFDNYISKVVFSQKYLIIGLENGTIILKDFKTLKNIYKISLPKIHDFMGDEISMPIYSLDILGNKLIILAESENAKRDFFLFDIDSKKLKLIFETKDTLMKLKFLNKDRILFGLLSDELMLYNLKNRKQIYKKQIGNYVFSTYSLNKNLVVVGDETGKIKLVEVKTGKKIGEFSGFNKDQTLSLDFKGKMIINATADKKVGLYRLGKGFILGLKTEFLPYVVALSPKLDKFVVQYDEKNRLKVYSIYKTELFTLKGHTMALSGVKFVNENEIMSFSPAEILIWNLKKGKK